LDPWPQSKFVVQTFKQTRPGMWASPATRRQRDLVGVFDWVLDGRPNISSGLALTDQAARQNDSADPSGRVLPQAVAPKVAREKQRCHRPPCPQPQALQDRHPLFRKTCAIASFFLIRAGGATGSIPSVIAVCVPARTQRGQRNHARFNCGGGQRSYHRQRTRGPSTISAASRSSSGISGVWSLAHTLPAGRSGPRADIGHVRIVVQRRGHQKAFGPRSG